MTLNMKEKEHWKDRIAQKIERRIKVLVSTFESDYLESMPTRVREKAIERLGLIENQAKQAEVKSEIERLDQTLTKLKHQSLVIASNHTADAILKMTSWQLELD